MKIGLVLEGGAMRGVFSAGVLDSFLDHGISFDLCLGVSAGACLACSFLAKQRGRGYAVMTDYRNEKDYCSLSSLIRTGDLFGADFLYHKIPEELYPIDNAAFLQNKTSFYSVVTNCSTGQAEYLPVTDLLRDVDYIRASSSLPLLARMVELNGEHYLDGGVSDPIPVQKALELGCDKVIVVLTRPRDYKKGKERSVPFLRLKYRRYPNLIRDMAIRHEVYNRTQALLSYLEQNGTVYVLSPQKPLNIHRAEKDLQVLRAGYDHGFSLAEGQMEGILEYLRSS